MRRIWRGYRGLGTRWQVVIGVVVAALALSPLADEEPEQVAAVSDADIADELPFASTTTTTAARTVTTELPPVTTTTTVPRPPPPPPPTTTTTTSTTALPPPPTTVPPTPTTQAFVAPPPPAATSAGCHPSYDPCVPIASDVDCAGGSGNGPEYVSGPVRVIGTDDYGLDGNDNDGWGCE